MGPSTVLSSYSVGSRARTGPQCTALYWASVYGVADCGVDYYDVSTTEMIIVQKAWRTEARTLI
jgi:hypothetical protein